MPYVITAQGRQPVGKELLPSDWPASQLVEPKMVTFQAEDGLTIHGQLFTPQGRTTAGPALLFMHGGSKRQMLLGFHYMYYYHNSYAMNQYLASLGYVVLSVNYRTGIMYGRKFREPADGGWRGARGPHRWTRAAIPGLPRSRDCRSARWPQYRAARARR